MDKKTPLTEFDINTSSWLLQMAKAALPFFDIDFQRHAAMLIRFMEFQHTMNFFRRKEFVQQCGFSCHKRHGLDMEYIKELAGNEQFLNAICPYCPPALFGIIKNYKLFSGMSDLFKNSNMQADILRNFESFSDISGFSKSTESFPNISFDSNTADILAGSNPAAMFMSQMSGEQKNLYDEYLKQLDNIL